MNFHTQSCLSSSYPETGFFEHAETTSDTWDLFRSFRAKRFNPIIPRVLPRADNCAPVRAENTLALKGPTRVHPFGWTLWKPFTVTICPIEIHGGRTFETPHRNYRPLLRLWEGGSLKRPTETIGPYYDSGKEGP